MKHLYPLMILVAALVLAPAQNTLAALITGDLDLSGTALFDTPNVNTATGVQVWDTTTVFNATGAFTNLPSGSTIAFSPATWTFNSGPVSNFWSAGGFRFDLATSSIDIDGKGYLNILFTGTISGNGYDATACTGTFSSVNVGGDGDTFSQSMTFSMVPPPPNLRLVANGQGSWKILWPTNGIDPSFNYAYKLQRNNSLASTNWMTPGYSVTNGFGTNFCTFIPPTGNMFYRLSQ